MNIKVMVNAAQLLRRVRENASKHKEQYEEAAKAYCEKQFDFLTKKLDKLAQGIPVEIWAELAPPRNHMATYDSIISALGDHKSPNIEIDTNEYQKLVNDEWDWKGSFAAAYNSSTGKSLPGRIEF